MDPKQLEREMDDLEAALVLLKRDYEIYFSGGAKLPPIETHRKLEKTVRRFARLTDLTYAQRFRFNNLSARFNSYVDLWNKQMRYKEEGRTPSGSLTISGEKPKVVTQAKGTETTADKFQRVYNDFLKARQQTGESVDNLSFEKFSQQLAKQKETILNKYQCKDVEFYVSVDNGHTKLKARPLK